MPKTYTRIQSSLGAAKPTSVVVLPVLFEGETRAVIELASLHPFTTTHLTLLEQLTQSIGVVLNTIEATMRTENLLEQSQQLTTELQVRQAELQQTNEELASKAKQLAEQNIEVERKNIEVEQARRALEEKAAELALTSKYKSEFLANMSHELRTPLNSILILGQQLAENAVGNLQTKQVEYARNIHSAGTDLLTLINDILDLSKIESGTVTVEAEEITFAGLRDNVDRTFHHLAETKKLAFTRRDRPDAAARTPHRSQTAPADSQEPAVERVQVHRARARLDARPSTRREGWTAGHPVLSRAQNAVAFEVTDSGIGIPAEKQKLIFEAFHQADAGTSRKYGGTGLGLAISRELSTLLGGEIRLTSVPGQGSTFTLYLPSPTSGRHARTRDTRTPADRAHACDRAGRRRRLSVAENRRAHRRRSGDRSGRRQHAAHRRRRPALRPCAPRARARPGIPRHRGHARPDGALARARVQADGHDARRLPAGHAGLDRPQQPQDGSGHAAHSGADAVGRRGAAARPVARRVLLSRQAGDDDGSGAGVRSASRATSRRRCGVCWSSRTTTSSGESIVDLLAHDDIEIVAVGTGAAAMTALLSQRFDCCVVDLRLPDMSGVDLLELIQTEEPHSRHPGRRVHRARTSRRPRSSAFSGWPRASSSRTCSRPSGCSTKPRSSSTASSRTCPRAKQQLLQRLHGSNEALRDRSVLVVDDDVRNIFALSTLLENQGMDVASATNGRQAIELLKARTDVSVVLMDIMMPEMDGYETMREIRQDARFRTLPILALTAKAMKGDREKCLAAGASDYIAKPVNTEQLLSLLRVWLHR